MATAEWTTSRNSARVMLAPTSCFTTGGSITGGSTTRAAPPSPLQIHLRRTRPTEQVEEIVRDLPAKTGYDAKAFAFDEQGRVIVEVGEPNNVYCIGDKRLGAKQRSLEEIAEFKKPTAGFGASTRSSSHYHSTGCPTWIKPRTFEANRSISEGGAQGNSKLSQRMALT